MIKRAAITGFLLVFFGYYLASALILRYSMDKYLFPRLNSVSGELEKPSLVVTQGENQLLIRRYGDSTKRCVIFFPGQHGGIANYQKKLFPPLVLEGVTVFAISYPGQDGARGQARLLELPGLIDKAIKGIESECLAENAVFVGRSLGSMVAAFQAVHWHPKGLVLEGISPSFSDAIDTYLARRWYLYPLRLLPVKNVIRRDYVLANALDNLGATKIAVFQGELDARTKLSLAKRAVAGRNNIDFVEVHGADHSNTYTKVLPQYVATILGMFAP